MGENSSNDRLAGRSERERLQLGCVGLDCLADITGTLNGVQYCTSTLNGGAGNDGHRSTSQLFTDRPQSNLVLIQGALAKARCQSYLPG